MEDIGVVLGADGFRPNALDAPIGDVRGPWRGEDLGILDRDRNLQPLAVTRVDGRDPRLAADAARGVLLPYERSLSFLSLDQPVTLDKMQRLALRRAQSVDHGERLEL